MPTTIVNGVDLYYECHGKGQPLMLIAGLASDSQSWQPIVEELSQHYLVILPDNRGTGRTKPQDVETSIQQIADDCIALLGHLQLPSATLLGHSMGGFAALDCAIRYPAHVSKLILVGTSAVNSDRNNNLFRDWVSYLKSGMDTERWFRNVFYWIFSRRFFENSETLNDALRFAIEYPYPQSDTAFAKQVNAIEEFDCREQLPGIKAKTLIISGQEDLLFPPKDSARVLQAIPSTSVCLIADAAHSIHMESPTTFTDCVLHFLSDG
ncbi:alpha/beta fold hydrolase [Microbulbifer marinus]|uniref:Pimeloyl-ACP methyl ester carboxylesterase n=1 Tax=Microbulbifer marinus TaxID=658218 RepID=A0A1H3WV44_9GAMM|nr:alpha/beta hydrolase [Microbulbifer marinus]SDZ91009.1 Pimeloyl-ACP methyl ester carboxylesterase [Microbulbifer marinus]